MSERQPSDAAIRLQATDPRHSFLVQAPAGSGKTELLTDRMLALLSTVKRPEDIVAITFTRKAAAEMHERVLEKLTKGLSDTPPALEHERRGWEMARKVLERDREHQWEILHYPARLTIRTIDSFCASLVRAMPWMSSMGGLPGISEDARPHYLAAATATLELAASEPEVKRLLQHMDLDVTATRDALADMLSQRDQWLPHVQQVGRTESAERDSGRDNLEHNLQQAIERDLERLLVQMPAGWAQELAPFGHYAASSLMATGASHPIEALLDWSGEEFEASIDELGRWKGLAALLLKKEGDFRQTVDKGTGFPPVPESKLLKAGLLKWLDAQRTSDEALVRPEWVLRLAAIAQAPQAEFTAGQWSIIQAQIRCLNLAAGQLVLQFIRAGEVDFIEIARRADLALGHSDEPTELLLKLDASIQHLLIDEFQDTSLSQISLITKLTSGWQQGDGRSLFLVGDPMQSIYRFRKADVSLFIKVRDQGLEGLALTCLQLTDNFRSQGKIVQWVNATFKPMLPETDDPTIGAISYATSVAFKADTTLEAVQYHSFLPGDEQTSQHCVVELARQALAQFNQPQHKHPVAILVRARAHLLDVTQLLQQAGIACRAVELVPLYKRSYVIDLVQLARALTHPADRLAWLSVLRSPYCGLTLESLHRLFAQPYQTISELLRAALEPNGADQTCMAQQVLMPAEFLRLRAAATILLDALVQDDVQPFAARLEGVWRALAGPSFAQSEADLQDAESLFELIERLAPYGALDLDVLEERLKKLYAAPDPHERAVEIMTMHKCKGLQFETVILYGLQKKPPPDRSPLLRFEQVGAQLMLGPIKARASKEQDPIAKYLAAREKCRGEFEIDRLLYVAATRAKEVLHLVADFSLANKELALTEPTKGSLLERLWPTWNRASIARVLVRPEDHSKTMPFYRGGLLSRLARVPLPSVGVAHASLPSDATATATPEVANAKTAPALAAAPTYNAAYAWPATKTYERVLGTLTHAWLDHLGEQGVASWSERSLFEQRARIERQCVQAGVPAPEVANAAHEVLETLLAMLRHDRGQNLLRQVGARREWALLDASGKVSVLDLALQDERGWLVVDYKTGRPLHAETPQAFGQRMLSRYAKQLQGYCDQVTGLDGRAARAALYFPRDDLWFEFEPSASPEP
ncbi:MAG: nuclease [Alcaligenaceae bacterium]|nr:MAG: nuclease [Alcaligenaceae bacterium]